MLFDLFGYPPSFFIDVLICGWGVEEENGGIYVLLVVEHNTSGSLSNLLTHINLAVYVGIYEYTKVSRSCQDESEYTQICHFWKYSTV